MKRVVLLMAMKEEAQPLIDCMSMQKEILQSRRQWHMPLYRSLEFPDFYLLLHGSSPRYPELSRVGTQAAAIATTLAIECLGAELLVNAGTAGGFASRCSAVGDLYLASRAFYHDRRIPISNDWQCYARGDYPLFCPREWLDRYDLKEAYVSTGNSLDFVERDLDLLHAVGAHVKDMETAAIAEIAELHGIGLVALKSITDIVDGERPTADEFMANLTSASSKLVSGLEKLLREQIFKGFVP